MRDKFDLKELTNEIPLGEFLKYDEPILVSRTNAVSGKLLLASEMSRFDTVGYDCAAVCINDMYAMGAKPLLFYDNISCARPKFEYIRDMEEGMENGCRQGNVTYAGSEIKELSDIFSYDQYDLVGFIAGVVEKKKKIGIAQVKAGDVIIGLPSNGLHNNGYVAARRKLYLTKTSMEIYYESLGSTLGDLLLAPTRMYRDAMEALLQSEIEIKSCVQVDLMGQVKSESIGPRQISGVGGQVDFVRGANLSKGGRAIMAMPSTTGKGKISKIVPFLDQGSAVTTTRNEVNYVITEYGIAKLKGKSLRQRAEALIRIAHPDFRDALTAEFRRRYPRDY